MVPQQSEEVRQHRVIQRPSTDLQEQHEQEAQPLIHQSRLNTPINTDNASNNSRWEDEYDRPEQAAITHRNHREGKQHPALKNHRPLSIQSGYDDEDEDIVCCDSGGVHWREGTKNLCTIALWAMLFFVIVNRFFVHMAMHLHKNDASGARVQHNIDQIRSP